MWPGQDDYWWPDHIQSDDTLESVIALFVDVGYEPCDNHEVEGTVEKVAIYGDDDGPSHVARQLESGRWTSKLGDWEDIEHDSLRAVEGSRYGTVRAILRRSRRGQPA